MQFLSVCSGIEAASVAWTPLGWRAVAFSEIDPFCRSVLTHRFPHTRNLGDMRQFVEWPDIEPIGLLCGGTPCQSYSVAGDRGGVDDPRGELMLAFGAIAASYSPRWVVWENVPGVLSTNSGRDFGAFLGMLGELGYGFAYRVLDARHWGVAQRRRRVFVVGHLGDWHPAAAVLFERASMQWGGGKGASPWQDAAAGADGIVDADDWTSNAEGDTGLPFLTRSNIGKTVNNQTPLIPATFNWMAAGRQTTLGYDPGSDTASPVLRHQKLAVTHHNAVRRLTPRECERLQGFPDDWTLVPHKGKPAPDSLRYRAIGDSWAVPCVRWIGQRIAQAEALMTEGASQ